MRQTMVFCDLHDGTAEASASVQVLIDSTAHRLDVCADHASWLQSLPVHDGVEPAGPAAGARVLRPVVSLDNAGAGATTNPGRGAAVAAGRDTPGDDRTAVPDARPATPRVRAGSRRSLRAERAAARDWARTQGREVADRGRLPAGLLEEYREEAG